MDEAERILQAEVVQPALAVGADLRGYERPVLKCGGPTVRRSPGRSW